MMVALSPKSLGKRIEKVGQKKAFLSHKSWFLVVDLRKKLKYGYNTFYQKSRDL